MVLGFLTVGPGEMAIIAVIVLVLFGPERLPEIGKQIGMAYRELNRLRGDVQRALDIDEYTRFELPDYSAPLGQTYSYSPPAIEGTDSETNGFHDSYHAYDEQGHELVAPPGPPALFAMRQDTVEPMVSGEPSIDTVSGNYGSSGNVNEPAGVVRMENHV